MDQIIRILLFIGTILMQFVIYHAIIEEVPKPINTDEMKFIREGNRLIRV